MPVEKTSEGVRDGRLRNRNHTRLPVQTPGHPGVDDVWEKRDSEVAKDFQGTWLTRICTKQT